MPATLTYPGVYVEEIPSGVRTITGVATSITVFMGRARRGPVNEPVTINSFADFERTFGGLWLQGPMSYAVRDFYLNGGSQAIIVRLFAPVTSTQNEGTVTDEGIAELKFGDSTQFKLKAVSPGLWGNDLRVEINQTISDDAAQKFEPYGLTKADLFNLNIVDIGANTSESYATLSLKEGPRRIDRVLNDASNLVVWSGGDLNPPSTPALPAGEPTTPPAGGTPSTQPQATTAVTIPTTKVDKISEKEIALVLAQKELRDGILAGKTGTELENLRKKVTDAKTAVQTAKDQTKAGNNGVALKPTHYLGSVEDKEGLYALEKVDLFNLLCVPPDTREGDIHSLVYQEALAYCARRRAMLIVDPPAAWGKNKETAATQARNGLTDLGLAGTMARNAALYFPRVVQSDPLRDGQLDIFVPCGLVAGVMARTDVQRGVWKAPAGIDAALNGIQGLEVNLTDDENGMLNPIGINCLRSFPIIGRVVWGARTLRGADQLADEWKYIPVRRLALYIEESLFRGLQWVVFEPNDEPLWAQIRLNVGAFMHNLFRQQAFQGSSPREAYFVKCSKETTTQNDINLGIVNIHVGFAPLKPAEFVVLKLQQIAGQVEA